MVGLFLKNSGVGFVSRGPGQATRAKTATGARIIVPAAVSPVRNRITKRHSERPFQADALTFNNPKTRAHRHTRAEEKRRASRAQIRAPARLPTKWIVPRWPACTASLQWLLGMEGIRGEYEHRISSIPIIMASLDARVRKRIMMRLISRPFSLL